MMSLKIKTLQVDLNRVTDLQNEVFIRDRELSENDKLAILNKHLKMQIEEMSAENASLKQKNDIMRQLMLEFDINTIELKHDEDVHLI